MLHAGKIDEAIVRLRKTLSLDAGNLGAISALGKACYLKDNYDAAIEYSLKAVALDENSAQPYVVLSGAYEAINDIAKAEEYAKIGVKLDPVNFSANMNLAKVFTRRHEYAEAAAILQDVAQRYPDAAETWFRLGFCQDKLLQCESAFQSYAQGNRKLSKVYAGQGVNKNTYLMAIEETFAEFSAVSANSCQRAPGSSAIRSPVFMVGFPRSGTTLLDQIINSHSKVQVVEEQGSVDNVVSFFRNRYGYSLNSNVRLDAQSVALLQKNYFAALRQYLHDAAGEIIVDKLPLNTINIPAILNIFPDAKIIFSLRHPCDVVLSNFFQSYQGNSAMANFLTIADSANLYAKVMDLWQLFVANIPMSYHMVKYESLVDNFNEEVEGLLNFLGLEWEDSILEYRDRAKKRRIATPSRVSVSEKIYRSSKYRYKRYLPMLQPVVPTLEPYIRRFGYSV